MSHFLGQECSYCGCSCYGECGDPDRCRSCWYGNCFRDVGPALCEEDECECPCHEDDDEIWNMYQKYNLNLQHESFPFLKLPAELRNKIYHYHLKQYGHRRQSPYYKGTIETAILSTCRQINEEARHIPLSTNTISFSSPFQAYHFLGFEVLPSQKHLLKSVHIDMHVMEDCNGFFVEYLVPQLTKLKLSHLSITLQGKIETGWSTNIKSLATQLSTVKGLVSFNLVIGSGVITDAIKGKIVDALRQKLLEDPEPGKTPLKWSTSADRSLDSTAVPTSESRDTATTNPRETANRQVKNKSPTSSTKKTPGLVPNAFRDLMDKYNQLEQYARSYNPEATSVSIRLKRAHRAASEGKDIDFQRLAEDILGTLDAHFARIVATRTRLPYRLLSSSEHIPLHPLPTDHVPDVHTPTAIP